MRIRGGLLLSNDVVGGPESIIGAVGSIIATNTAVAVGVSSLPDPLTDIADEGWVMYQAFGARGSDPQGVGLINGLWVPFDSRGMRKLREGETLVTVIANAHATHAFDIDFQLFRLLSKSRM